MIVRKLPAWLTGSDRRILRAEAAFFDAYCRGGWRAPRELVVPIDYFARPRVRTLLRAWLREARPLDLDGLHAAWRAALPTDAPADERLFFKNLADFVALLHAGPPTPTQKPRALPRAAERALGTREDRHA